MSDFPDIILYAIPFFVIAMLLEIYVVSKQKLKGYETKDAVSSISMGIGNVLLGFLSKAIVLLCLSFVYTKFKFFTIPIAWWSFIVLLFLDDFSYYWFHRISLGFHPGMIMLQMSVSLIYQFWIHTEAINKLPKWVEYIMNTPSHHRVHHGSNPLYLDRNHAGIFIIWDRLFGTFQVELEEEKVVYGLVKNIDTYNPVKIAFLEWYNLFKDIFSGRKSIKQRFLYLIKPPGWKHNGTGKISDDLRKEWLERQSK